MVNGLACIAICNYSSPLESNLKNLSKDKAEQMGFDAV